MIRTFLGSWIGLVIVSAVAWLPAAPLRTEPSPAISMRAVTAPAATPPAATSPAATSPAAFAPAVPLAAHDRGPEYSSVAENRKPADNDDASQGLIPFVVERFKVRRNRYPGDEGKNHTMVKAPFREVVAGASRGTVQVLCKDRPVALGTVVRSDGYIVTKASELSGDIVCKFTNDELHPARLIGIHDETDLALLKIEAENLVPVRWARAGSPAVGSFLATAGVDGEPLAIGVVSVAQRTIPAQSGVLGIAVGQADDGPRVDQVLEGTSAERAGLQANDIIVRINDRAVTTREGLIDLVGSFQPGDRVHLKIRRGEEVLDISTTLGSRMTGSRRDFQNRLGGSLSERRGGFAKAIQHDTVLRPRECGGPLVDLDGQVVGVNIARAERVASYAIPTATVLEVLDELMPSAVARKESPRPAPTDARTGRVTVARPVR